MPPLLEACPSFSKRWEEFLENETEERLPYIEIGYFGHHLVDLLEQGDTREFDIVERLHLEGDDYVRGLATIGLLESIQNHAAHRRVEERNASPEAFEPYLRPETARWWRGLNNFWEGRSPTVQPTD